MGWYWFSHSLYLTLSIPWTVAHQAPLFMGFFRQESWSGLPFPSQGDLPDPGIKPRSPALQTDSLLSEPLGKSTLGDYNFFIDMIFSLKPHSFILLFLPFQNSLQD